MGRAPCCDKANVKKGPWSPEEDAKLKHYMELHGTGGNWIALPQKAGLRRCGKSCRLRWLNYLRPNIKHGDFSDEEDRIICTLFTTIGSRWSIIAAHLPGRTDNDIKNYWNTKLKKKLIMGMIPIPQMNSNYAAVPSLFGASPSSSSSSPPTCHGGNQTAAGWSFVGPNTPPYGHQVQDNAISFGAEASCSSSDGSCTNQLSYGGGGVIDGGEQMGNFQMFFGGIEDRKPINSGGGMIGEGGWTENKQITSMWEETPLDCSLEEVNRLISTNSCSNNNFSFDEFKAEERVLYF